MNEKVLPPKRKDAVGARHTADSELITSCPKCGGEVALWSAEQETVCIFCNHRLFEHEGTLH